MTAASLGRQGRKRQRREQEDCPGEVAPGLTEEPGIHGIAMGC